ncbi:DEAD/DEAH box helicase [Lactococcus formosensis]|uniref:DEAD/DEAH box helicase n=1 Tax=Lactococcus formosensis TaxID=1281486 RepID=A0A9X4SJV4_9LACT|nr:DEAD/DEAH box helicase [Lactococcus formosensis]MDG6142983.1 DEAD/DEAH box helicase [Lactococcus formosensis]MDG6156276.1 DEAD/DEAH box helicase [Lactococcus formosensis]MDG6160459.1 DEAD/DEAH box helicase [Lactococcus formosensis]MDG6167090.1 DEAD/DEAH box helicase [Lactococcus formosensis]MDG6173358.1 DEAD/DEAH box helicase [Lactococcus formosensis]
MNELYGRLLLQKELTKIPDEVILFDGMKEVSKTIVMCNRCGKKSKKKEVYLPVGAYYCPHCIQMGRVRSDEKLYHLPQKNFAAVSCLKWQGKLTGPQQYISDNLLNLHRQQKTVLVQAVTGAGKTEMIYQVIDATLKKGKAVGLTSPRIDVCLELYYRLKRDFSCPISLLHGKGEKYSRSPLVIATTHQLLRFRHAFDLLILDKVDAFPFPDNEMLYFALAQARKPSSSLIYLTATTTNNLEKQVKLGQIEKLQLPRRFHGFPLVLPQFFWQSKFYKMIKKQRESGLPLLIFAPEIRLGEKLCQDLQSSFPHEEIAFVASTSLERLESVERFRHGKVSILVSTTILERGVTFPKVDVFVFQSHHHNFTRSSLIQIAGRVGRSTERPDGKVIFFHLGKTTAMLEAYKDIRNMNKAGGFQ